MQIHQLIISLIKTYNDIYIGNSYCNKHLLDHLNLHLINMYKETFIIYTLSTCSTIKCKYFTFTNLTNTNNDRSWPQFATILASYTDWVATKAF